MQMEMFGAEVVVEGFDAQEEWRSVTGFVRYEVSSLGRFRRKSTGRILGGKPAHNGYLHIGLLKDGKQTWRMAHRLVAEAFLYKPSEKHNDVNHKNKVRNDNRTSNLEWLTRSQNAKHAWATP